MPAPDGPQFNIEHPFPRLRNAYAKTWAKSYSQMMEGEGTPISHEDANEVGQGQADNMVEIALYPDAESQSFARHHLYRLGFQRRHDQ